jgi:hypothetical protein
MPKRPDVTTGRLPKNFASELRRPDGCRSHRGGVFMSGSAAVMPSAAGLMESPRGCGGVSPGHYARFNERSTSRSAFQPHPISLSLWVVQVYTCIHRDSRGKPRRKNPARKFASRGFRCRVALVDGFPLVGSVTLRWDIRWRRCHRPACRALRKSLTRCRAPKPPQNCPVSPRFCRVLPGLAPELPRNCPVPRRGGLD